jgi:hypothetical protein
MQGRIDKSVPGAHAPERCALTVTNFNPGTSLKSFAFPVSNANFRSTAWAASQIAGCTELATFDRDP